MLGKDLILKFEIVTKKELLLFFKQVTIFFPKFLDNGISEKYATKLSCNADFITVRYNNEIVGMIAYYMNVRPICYLSFCCTLQDYQNKGIFINMLKEIEIKAQANDFTTIKLEVSNSNVLARKLYEKIGFVYDGVSERGFYMVKKI